MELSQALARLRAAADQVHNAFPTTQWTQTEGPGPEQIELSGAGHFHGLRLGPSQDIAMTCRLDLPEEVLGVPLAGDALEGTLFSLYPTEIASNGKMLFAEEGVPVAAGPVLFTVVPQLQAGDNGELTFRIRVPNNQMTTWVHFKLTTPGLRARFEALDIAWAQLALADALAVTPDEREIVAKAAALVPETLSPLDTDTLQTTLSALALALSPLAEKAATHTVHLIGHSHIDMNWLWTWPDTVATIKRDFKSVLALMEEYPELTFSHSQPATYEVIRQEEPELFARVLEHIQEGRWEPITMTWLEGDVNMASGEAHARQLLEGVTYTRDLLGAEPTTYHAPDTFGHAGNLPQLAASAGAVRYYHHRANPGQENQWPAYWWEGQEGTRILAISTYSYNGEIHARDLANAAIRAHKFGQKAGLHFHGIGDHGGGPSRQNLDALHRFQGTPGLPTAFCSRLDAYTDELLKAGGKLPEVRGETRTIFEGCYTTHADTKRYNREGENLLCTADTLAALAGQNHNAELTEAWRKVLFNQFHDILDGSAIHESYEKNRTDFEEVQATAQTVIDAALQVLQQGPQPGENEILVAVTNPLGFDREDLVVVPGLPEGQVAMVLQADGGHTTTGQFTPEGLAFLARVPAYGTVRYKVLPTLPSPLEGEGGVLCGAAERRQAVELGVRCEPAYAPTDAREVNFLAEVADNAPYYKVETPFFRVYVRRDCGILVSLFDKRLGRELVSFGLRRASDYVDSARPDLALNVLQVLDEHPHGMSAWQMQEIHTEQSLLRGATTRIVETGPVRCVLEVTHTLRKSSIRQQIAFYRDLPRIDFTTHLDWQEIGNGEVGVPNLKAAFTARLDECEAWYETPFAAVRRPADGQEVPALRWANVGGYEYGIALLNDSKYGYDALGCRLRLTLVRSGYDPDAISDMGQHTIRYSLVPHPGSWREAGIVQAAAGFNQPLLARRIPATEGAAEISFRPSFAPHLEGNPFVQIACLKHAHDDNGLIVRLYESAGRSGDARLTNLPETAKVYETNIVEDIQRELSNQNGSVTLTFRPWQVRTVRVTLKG